MSDKKVVMVVDDDDMNIQMAEFILRKELNLDVVSASSGYGCIDLLQKGTRPDLILLDIQMPRMNGIQTLEVIRKRAEWKDIPVIFLTATADKDTVVKAGKLGVKDYIKKPFLPKDLVDRVGKILVTTTLEDPELAKLLDDLMNL